MSRRTSPLSEAEISLAFAGPSGDRFGPILSPAQFAELVGLSVKTIYEWVSCGRLDGAVRKRGKHVLIWRDRALQILLSGKDWK
jgi:excisionase family DNA binding protein